MEDFVSDQSLADFQACEKPELSRSLPRNTLLSEWADSPIVNLNYSVKDYSENSDRVLEIYPSISDDFYDDGLEYLECSDLLTARENEIWEKKLQFLLESDDEDDLKLSKDCDGCAYFLSEMPCLFQVSDNTTPMDTTIGLCGHHSKFKGVNVRRDPSTYSQSTLQTEMTLTVGHHREKTTGLKDKENCKVPVAPAALENDYLKMEDKNNGSVHSATDFSSDKPQNGDSARSMADSSPSGTGAALTNLTSDTVTEGNIDADLVDESSLPPEEGRRNSMEENARHAVCTLTESLRRNLLKLLNPKELCRYEGVLSTQIHEETESLQMETGLCHTEEADKDSQWEQKRTLGLSEQNQVPYENVSPRNQGDSLKICAPNCDRQCIEPETEKERILTYSQHDVPCDKGESCHQQVFWEQGLDISSSENKLKNDTSSFPLWDTDSVPDKQECLCAVLSSAKLCDEPRERGQRYDFGSHDSIDTDTLCSISCDASLFEANPQSVLESGEPGCKGDADLAAVHDKLWKLFREDDSDCQIPFENCGITSLEMRPTGTRVSELNLVQETCSDHPLPQNVMEQQKPVTQAPTSKRTEKEDCSVSNILLKTDEAVESPQVLKSTQSSNLASDNENSAYVLDKSHWTTGQLLHTEQNIPLKYSYLMNVPDLINTPENITYPFIEVPKYEPTKTGREQRSICLGDEQRAETSCSFGVRDISESQSAASPPNMSEQVFFLGDTFKSDEELKPDSSNNYTHASGNVTSASFSTPLPRRVQNEYSSIADDDYRDSKGSLNSVSAMVSSGEGSQPQAECTQIPVKVDEKLISSNAYRQISNNITKQSSPDLITSSKLTKFDCSVESTHCHKGGEVMTSETAVSGLVGLPPADSGDNPYFQTQPPSSSTQPYSLAWSTYDPFPVGAKRVGSQERSKSDQTSPTVAEPEPVKCKQHIARGGNVATGAKKKLPPATLSKKPRLTERGNISKDPSCVKSDANMIYKENKKEQRKLISKKDSKVLEHLSNFQNFEGVEEIEFMQLMFREDFISDSYFGGNLHGILATEELHFGEGMHRKAFRSKVMQGLVPVFSPGHPCVLKVHNAITYGTKSKDDLVQRNYKLALQECYVQNTAREIIPIFLVHRPANNIPYATVEEELIGEFVKYSVKDGKEINFLRRDSEAGQKCCTFQHWVYEKTNGNLLVTDLQGVGMKLTDVGIATLAKGQAVPLIEVGSEGSHSDQLSAGKGKYKGFKGNCSISFIEQFRALHQCNKYCEMLGLKSLRSTHQKQRKPTSMKSKTLPTNSTPTIKKTVSKKAREPRDFTSSEN
ncbi:hypothetical protein ASZ78_016818 [Callipepla squamata]|uniref:Alpha-type protein kinase domain-containing protein n=1 Tax=Callipepla squamata TaxID=9009 RepID=A0A226MZK5_CALSU|nr:hypothetical protein ASZ78_016818 [Callipepla squamata]